MLFTAFYNKLTFLLLSSLLVGFWLSACSSGGRNSSKNTVDSVKLTIQGSESFFVDETKSVNVNVEVSGNASKDVLWSMEPENGGEVANIVSGGKQGDSEVTLQAKGIGKLVLTATSTVSSDKKDSIELTVKAPKIKNISISGTNSLILGQATTLRALVEADDESLQEVEWLLEPANILKIIREEGNELRVRSDASGSVVVKATSTADKNKQASMNISISEKPPSAPATINGFTTNFEGDLLSAVKINALSGEDLRRAQTNKNGKYSLEDLPASGGLVVLSASAGEIEGVKYAEVPAILRVSPRGKYNFDFKLPAEQALEKSKLKEQNISIASDEVHTLKTQDGSVILNNLPIDITGGSARAFNPNSESEFFPNVIVNGQNNSALLPVGFVSLSLDDNIGTKTVLNFLLSPENGRSIQGDDNLLSDRPDRIDLPVYHFNEQINDQTKIVEFDWQPLPVLGWLEDAAGLIAEDQLLNIQQGNYPNDIFVVTPINTSGWFAAGYETQSACLVGRLLYSNAPDPVDFGNILVETLEGSFDSSIYAVTDALGNFRISGLPVSTNDVHKVNITYLGEGGVHIVFDNGNLGYTVPNTQETEENTSCTNLGDLLINEVKAEPKAEVRQYSIRVTDDKGMPLASDLDNNSLTEVTFWDNRVDGSVASELCAKNTCNALGQTNANGQVSFNIPTIPSSGDISVRVSHSASSNSQGKSEISRATFSDNLDASVTNHQIEVQVERSAISVSPNSLFISIPPIITFINTTDIKTINLEIRNTGDVPLSVTDISSVDPWLKFSNTQLERIAVGDLVNLEVIANSDSLQSGVYRSSIEISSSAGQISIPVTFAVEIFRLSGTVTELNGDPLAKANVSAESGGRSLASTSTDSNGVYELFLPLSTPREIGIVVSKTDYKTKFEAVDLLSSETTLDIELVKITDNLLFYEGFEDCESNDWGWVVNNSGYDGQVGTNDDGLWHCRDGKSIKNEALEKGFVDLLPADATEGFIPLPYAGNHAYWYGSSVPTSISPQAETGNYLGVQISNDDLGSGGTSLPKSVKDDADEVIVPGGNTGILQSPFIDLTGVSSARLEGITWYELESVEISQARFDQIKISLVSNLDGQLITHDQIILNPPVDPVNFADNLPYTSGGEFQAPTWIPFTIDLSLLTGQEQAAILFEFRTYDELHNGFRGWLIDELYVYEGSP